MRRRVTAGATVPIGRALVEAGLHEATGGTGMLACSGVTLRATLLKLTERFCVVYQTLANPPALTATLS